MTKKLSPSATRDKVGESIREMDPKGKSPGEQSHDAISSGLRDAYGLPITAERNGSVTEDLFGAGRSIARPGGGSAMRTPSIRTPGTQTLPDWQTDALPAAPPLDARPSQSAGNSSSARTFRFGNPNAFQPQGASPYSPYSPYSPIGPRSTGLQGDPTLRQPQLPYYGRRFERGLNPAAESGNLVPLVPPP